MPLAAGETGSIAGTVRDSSGAVLPGVTVTVVGPNMPVPQQSITDSRGRYRFPGLLPGQYTVTAELAGLGSVRSRAVASVDVETQVNLTLTPAVQEEITVTATVPVVDQSSTEVNFNYSAEKIQSLPLTRSYSGLFQLAPGVADNQSFAPNAGGSRQDNTFLLDGVNITNPYFGYLGTESNELDIAEFNVKRAAFSPEFGRSGGMVTNAVTRSGTNELDGRIRIEYQPKEFFGDSKHSTAKADTDHLIPAFGVGFPIVRDRLLFYGSGRFYRSERSGRVNALGPVPDETTDINEYFGKLNALPASNHMIWAAYRHRPATTEFAGVGFSETPSVATDSEGTNKVANAGWNWSIGSNTFLETKYLHMDEEGETVARTQLPFKPAFDPKNLSAMGYVYDTNYVRPNGTKGAYVGANFLALNSQNYARDEVKVSVSHFLDFGRTRHDLKAGFGWDEGTENLTRVSNGWGLVSLVQGGTQYQGVYYPEQPEQVGIGTTYSIYIQDDIRFGDRLVVNAGVLANSDEFSQETDQTFTFLEFGFGEQIQPRLGVNYNVRPDAGDKIWANYARYSAMEQKSSARSLAPRRLYTSEALFDATTGALISDKPSSNTVSKNIATDIDPTYMDEFSFGYSTPLGGRFAEWSLNAFYMMRSTKDFIEDYPQVLPSSSFIYDNIGAKREYDAITLEMGRRHSGRWSLDGSYSWSELRGNFDLDYASSAIFNTSSALEDGPGLFVDDEFREGVLSQDRTHVFKLFGSYQILDGLTLGGYFRSQSGTPWEARGRDWYNGYRRYLEPAGTHRNDTWNNLDMSVGYRVPLGGRVGISLSVVVLNVLDDQIALTRDSALYLDGRIRNLNNPPYLVQGTTQPNANYGEPTSYAPARRYTASVKLDF